MNFSVKLWSYREILGICPETA